MSKPNRINISKKLNFTIFKILKPIWQEFINQIVLNSYSSRFTISTIPLLAIIARKKYQILTHPIDHGFCGIVQANQQFLWCHYYAYMKLPDNLDHHQPTYVRLVLIFFPSNVGPQPNGNYIGKPAPLCVKTDARCNIRNADFFVTIKL